MSDLWLLGATARSGRAVVEQLAAPQLSPVLVGRGTPRLRAIAAATEKDLRIATAGSVEAVVAELSRHTPDVLINTIGAFTKTAVPVARAYSPGTHYVDVSSELPSLISLLALQDEAASSGRTFVTAAGFGVPAAESVVLKLCEGQPPTLRVRVDAVLAVESGRGRLGEALASTIVDAAAGGGRRYAKGRLERIRALSDLETLTMPDCSTVKTACCPSGELEGARRAGGAAFALAASTLAPTSVVLRALLPPVMTLMRIRAASNFSKRRLAAVARKRDPGRTRRKTPRRRPSNLPRRAN